MCQSGSGWEGNHLLFRDYLRAQPDVRKSYRTLRRELARVWPEVRPAYTDAKTRFILDAMSNADIWAAATKSGALG